MVKVKPLKALSLILFILEWGTMLYFIPLLIYLAEFSFGMPGVGFLVGILCVVHYFIFRWYYDRGSLVYFGVSLVVGALGAGFSWFFDIFKDIFLPAQYLFEYSRFVLPQLAGHGQAPLFYYYVFLTGIMYVAIGKFLLVRICDLKLEKCRKLISPFLK